MILPNWWDTTITVYNKYEDPTTSVVTWYRNVITNCFWKYLTDKVVVGNTVLQSNNTICRIGKNSKFIEKYKWNALSANDKGRKFTLGVGDIIVKGKVTDIVNEYGTSGTIRSNDLINKYKDNQGCIIIDSVSLNDGAGRGMRHYLVKGL